MSEFDCALPNDKVMASHRTEPLSREQVKELCNGRDVLSSVGWCMLLDTDAALRAQHTADELCIKAQADELTRVRAQLERFRTMSTIEMMCENYNVKAHVEEWETRCLKAEQQLAQMTAEREEWKSGAMADATGHMFRCAKVNGVWKCAQGCAVQQLADARAEIAIADKLLLERNRILDALPCPAHGPCVPYVLHWIAEAQARIKELEARP